MIASTYDAGGLAAVSWNLVNWVVQDITIEAVQTDRIMLFLMKQGDAAS